MSGLGQAYNEAGVMEMNCAWNELLAVLPPRLRNEVDRQGRDTLQEIRLRSGQPVTLVKKEHNIYVDCNVRTEDLNFVVNMACRYSPWTVSSTAQGYITVSGGHRIGMCGEALLRNRRMCGIGSVSSLNIRVCRDFVGISGDLWKYQESLLLIGPPGSGKTTLLRDLIRRRSQRENVAVVDERGEIFPSAANFPRGTNTDIITGCPKDVGLETVLRVMGPACIAVDEVSAVQDCDSLIQAGKCGVSLLATAHATSLEDLYGRPIYGRLLSSGLFDRIVILQMDKSWRTERVR